MNTKLTMQDLEQMAKELLDIRPDGWEKPILFDLSKLMEECGEVAECFNKSKKTKDDLADELADVLVVIFVLALKSGIDLDQAMRNKQIRRVSKLVMRFHNGIYPSKAEG